MLLRKSVYLYCFFLCISSFRLYAQVPPRAQQLYKTALYHQAKHQPAKAEQALRQAIRIYPAFTDAYILLGGWLNDKHLYRPAADLLLQAEQACPNGKQLFAKAIVRNLVYSGDFANALQRIPPSSNDKEWKQLNTQARFMQIAMNSKNRQTVVPFSTPERINTGDPEMFPTRSADGSIFYFTRRVNGIDEDLYFSRKDSCGEWLRAHNMGMPPNSSSQESAQSLSADRHYLFMTRCDNRTENGWSQGGCDLFMAYTADSLWSVPLSFGATINTPSYEGMASLSGDNRELFFVSDRPGGFGGFDIWSSRFEHGLWQMPRNLGPAINTSSDETAPYIYADNETLYFASTGHEGMGGHDLFISKRINDTTWSTPVNAGWPVNTPFDEISMSLNAAGDTAYFASDRDGPAGNFNIFEVALQPAQQPVPVTYISGYVFDSLEKTPLNYANIYFTDSATKRERYHMVSNRGDASYTIALPIGHTYYLTLSRVGYQQLSDTIRTIPDTLSVSSVHNFSLLPFGYQKPVTEQLALTLFFKRNSSSISDSDKAVLARELESWRGQRDFTILVNGYTDNSGTPLLNEQISTARAQFVSTLINAMGFTDNVFTQGWGEANALVENDTEEHRAQNRRVEIIIRK